MLKVVSAFLIVSIFCFSAPAEEDSAAYWDYGIGLGAIRFEQYPSSDQYRTLAIPTPTFQYRGKILRADDKDGAHAYLYKAENFKIEIAGTGSPALDSDSNDARKGMDDLPWMLALGPEIVSNKIHDHLELGLAVFQATTTDFKMTRFDGVIFEGRARYDSEYSTHNTGHTTFTVQGGSKEFQSLYYKVPANAATQDRPAYEARDGFFKYVLSYYQSYKSGRLSVNFGGSLSAYDLGANTTSPLHKSNYNTTIFFGINYVLGGSSRPEVPENETSGLINSIRHNRQLRDSL